MINTSGIKNNTGIYTKPTNKASNVNKNEALNTNKALNTEDKLSDKAKEYLKTLREKYGDYNFVIAEEGEEKAALVNKENKEFSVIFSSAEIERMAENKNYAEDKMDEVNRAIKMTRRINELFGFETTWGEDGDNDHGSISQIAIRFHEDGKITILADLEKAADKQREIVEKNSKERAEKAEEARARENEKLKEAYGKKKDEHLVKRTQVSASTEEELIDKIMKIDWDSIKEEAVMPGDKINFEA